MFCKALNYVVVRRDAEGKPIRLKINNACKEIISKITGEKEVDYDLVQRYTTGKAMAFKTNDDYQQVGSKTTDEMEVELTKLV